MWITLVKGYGIIILIMDTTDNRRLKTHARSIRRLLLHELVEAGSGHTAGSLGLVDILTAIYGEVLSPDDKFLVSNGHIVPAQYAAFAEFGLIPRRELGTLRKLGSRLQGHPERVTLPSLLETTSGPLGEGVGQAAGMALAKKLDGQKGFIYVLTGDGELQEGNIWESLMFGSAKKLDNLVLIIDRNRIQISGGTETVMPLENLRAKLESFGWHTEEIDGHDFKEILTAVKSAKSVANRPHAIIAHTIPGKGIKEIEGDHYWHGKAPSEEQEKKWLKAL